MGCLRYISHPLLIECNLSEVAVSGTLEPEVIPTSHNSGEEVKQSNQGSSSQSDTILERPKELSRSLLVD